LQITYKKTDQADQHDLVGGGVRMNQPNPLVTGLCIYTWVETIKRQIRAAYDCLVAVQSSVAAGLSLYGLKVVHLLCLWHNSAAAAAVAACGAIYMSCLYLFTIIRL